MPYKLHLQKRYLLFSFYFSQSKCPSGAVGFVGSQIGLCKCRVTSTDDICDRECKNQQKYRLSVICTDPPKLKITSPDNVEVKLYQVLRNFQAK